MVSKSVRNRAIHQSRVEGQSYAEIARTHGISRERARDLFLRMERKLERALELRRVRDSSETKHAIALFNLRRVSRALYLVLAGPFR
jgi:transposase-like protein